MTTSELKERLRAVINHVVCDGGISGFQIVLELNAILRDLEAEPPKPTGEQLKAIGKDTGMGMRRGSMRRVIEYGRNSVCLAFLQGVKQAVAAGT